MIKKSLNWLKSKLSFYTKIMLGMGIKIYFSMSYAKAIYYRILTADILFNNNQFIIKY